MAVAIYILFSWTIIDLEVLPFRLSHETETQLVPLQDLNTSSLLDFVIEVPAAYKAALPLKGLWHIINLKPSIPSGALNTFSH